LNLLRAAILGFIGFYQQVWGPHAAGLCRFEPSCSCYADEAVRRHGVGRGLGLAARRLLRCRPFGPSGYDPVP
jgi:putative membrane protein insertion efficiency factor